MRLLAGVLVVCALAVGTAQAGQEATFVLDRTYACAVPIRGGIYQLENRAHSGARIGSAWSKLAYVGLRAGVFSGGTANLLAWISAGTPTRTTTVDQEYWTFDVKTFGTIGINGRACNPSSAKVPLSPAGLRGGAADRLGSELTCEVPRRVLIRVRAVLGTRASLRGKELETVHVPAREAKIAARTVTGKPLAFATVTESGKATLFAAKGCVPD